MKRGEYTLEEIIEPKPSFTGKRLGSYKNQDVILKKGKYGLYAEWGDLKKSIHIDKDENLLEINDVIPLLDYKYH